MKKIIAISGSLRKDSYNTNLLRAAVELAPAELEIEIISLADIPLYNQDLDANFPAAAAEFKSKIKSADGIIFSTPEYNRSIPGVLKNAIDWASRPYGDNAFAKKQVLVIGASYGNIGTALAQNHLKQILLYLDAKINGQPEFYMSGVNTKFDETGKLIDEATKKHLTDALNIFL